MSLEAIAVVPEEGPGEGMLRFRDAVSGCVFYVGTPEAHPALWRLCMAGALDAYREFGVESALEYDSVINGRSTTMFMVGVDSDGRVVAGVRAQGPYRHVDEAHAVVEWRGHVGEDVLRRSIADRIVDGVIEVKSGWVQRDAPSRSALRAAVARGIVHATGLLGARYAVATADRELAELWRCSGATVTWRIPEVPYPDDRYRTVVLWWDRNDCRAIADESQAPLLDAEQIQLAEGLHEAPDIASENGRPAGAC